MEATRDCKTMSYDRSLLSCLVDRWRPETHTFHFPWGEMAPTLQDVSMILGLPLSGAAIGPLDPPDDWATAMRDRFAGVLDGIPHPMPGGQYVPFASDANGPRISWMSQYQVISLVNHVIL